MARKSPLTKRANQRRNTQTGRNRMSTSNFAVPKGKGSKPGQNQYRVDDAAHARNALARVSQFGTPEEKRLVRNKVARKFPSVGKSGTARGKRSGTSKRKR